MELKKENFLIKEHAQVLYLFKQPFLNLYLNISNPSRITHFGKQEILYRKLQLKTFFKGLIFKLHFAKTNN
jgi:hypothetical protein